MYIMCVKVIAVPSQDSERSCILCVLRLSLYQVRTVSGHVYYVIHDRSLSWLGTAITLTHIMYMTAHCPGLVQR
jgi:hypothetical protein